MSTPLGEMLVVGPSSAFQLKLIPLNPREYTGAGAELSDSNTTIESLRSSPEFGLRPLHLTDIENLVEAMSDPVLSQKHLASIIRRDPILPADIQKQKVDHLLTGPVLTRPNLSSLSPDIMSLQRSLEKSAHRVFRDRYPMRAGMYF
ncbi:MAG: hypothetical protein ACFFD3_05975 [Candidatus Thorarchaeota archaeon]